MTSQLHHNQEQLPGAETSMGLRFAELTLADFAIDQAFAAVPVMPGVLAGEIYRD